MLFFLCPGDSAQRAPQSVRQQQLANTMKRERRDALSSNHSQTMQNARKAIDMIARGPLWIVLQDP